MTLVSSIPAFLPVDLGGKVCAYLDACTFMGIIPRVCRTWYTYLGQFIAEGHLNLKAFSWLNGDQFEECLSVMRNRVTKESLVVRSISLNLCSVRYHNSAVRALAQFPRLKQIDLGSVSELTDLSFLTHLKEVQSLEMRNASLSSDALYCFKDCPLQSLKCTNLSITHINGLKTVSHSLKELHLIQCLKLKEHALDVLEHLFIESLSLCGSEIERLPKLNAKSLRILDISHTRFLNVSCLQTIATLSSLTALNLMRCKWVTDLGPLQNHVALISLNLSRTHIRNHNLHQLPDQLTHLDLSRCPYLKKLHHPRDTIGSVFKQHRVHRVIAPRSRRQLF